MRPDLMALAMVLLAAGMLWWPAAGLGAALAVAALVRMTSAEDADRRRWRVLRFAGRPILWWRGPD